MATQVTPQQYRDWLLTMLITFGDRPVWDLFNNGVEYRRIAERHNHFVFIQGAWHLTDEARNYLMEYHNNEQTSK